MRLLLVFARLKRFFSSGVSSLLVFGVSAETRLDGRQAGYPRRLSRSERPQGFPVLMSTHSSANQRERPEEEVRRGRGTANQLFSTR